MKLAGFLTEHGFPISKSTLDKLAMPTRAEGPPHVGYWGNRALYDPDKSLAWAKKRFRSNWRGGAVMTNHVTVGEKAKSLSRCRARGRSSKQRVSTYACARQKAKET